MVKKNVLRGSLNRRETMKEATLNSRKNMISKKYKRLSVWIISLFLNDF